MRQLRFPQALLQIPGGDDAGAGGYAGSLIQVQIVEAAPSLWVTALPTVSVAATAIVFMCFFRFTTKERPAPEVARKCYLVMNVCSIINLCAVILDSYSLCAALGLKEAESGQMVGEYFLGQCLGALSSWWLAVNVHQLWKSHARKVLFSGAGLQLLGSVIYTVVAYKATSVVRSTEPTEEENLHRYATALLLGRIVSGYGAGLCMQFYISAMLHVTPVAERPEHTAKWILSTMVSFGLGPVIAGVSEMFVTSSEPRLELVGYLQLIFSVCTVFAVLVHPSLEGIEDNMEPPQEPSLGHTAPEGALIVQPPSDRRRRQKTVVLGCLLMTTLRSFMAGAAEVTVVQLLETEYGQSKLVAGLALGLMYAVLIPMKVYYDRQQGIVSPQNAIRCLVATSLFGSALLVTEVGDVLLDSTHLSHPFQLVLAGLVFLPTLSLADSLSLGIMHQHILPHKDLLDVNHTNLWYNIFVGLARFAGPWCSRALLGIGHKETLVLVQAAVTGAFWAFFEGTVAPNLLLFDALPDGELPSGNKQLVDAAQGEAQQEDADPGGPAPAAGAGEGILMHAAGSGL